MASIMNVKEVQDNIAFRTVIAIAFSIGTTIVAKSYDCWPEGFTVYRWDRIIISCSWAL